MIVLVAGALWALRDPSYEATPDKPASGPSARPALAAQTLADLVAAVEARDAEAAASLGATEEAGDLLREVVENANELQVRDFATRYVDPVAAGTTDPDLWSVAVDVTWAFARFDPSQSRTEVQFIFETDGERAEIIEIGGAAGRVPLWLTEALEVRRTPSALVLVDGSADEADQWAARVDTGVREVRRVLPDWRPRVVVEVASGSSAVDRAVGANPGTYEGIAAVTTTTDGALTPGAPVHVYVNPDVTDRLGPEGVQVVTTHELVHVATDAATSSTPLWLLEGFADYVALRDVDLPLRITAGRIIREVRRNGPPDALPGTAEFDTQAEDLEATYESAWLAAVTLVDRGGEDALVRFYESVQSGTSLSSALRSDFDWSEADLVRAWRNRLSELAQRKLAQ